MVIILNAYLAQSLSLIVPHVTQETSVFLVKVAIRFKKEFANLVGMRIQPINTTSKTIFALFVA